MLEKLDEPIDVQVNFKDSKIVPVVFRWRNKIYKIININMVHQVKAGDGRIYYFSVSDNANFFRLAFFTKDLTWRIEEIFYA